MANEMARYIASTAIAGVVYLAAMPAALAGKIDVSKPFNLELNLKENNNYVGTWKYDVRSNAEHKPPGPDPKSDAATLAFAPPATNTKTVNSVSGATNAKASATFTAGAVTAGKATGSHGISEETNLNGGVLAATEATSILSLQAVTRDAKGKITKVNPTVFVSTIQNGRARDPWSFSVYDLDLDILTKDTLFDFDVKLNGVGDFDWADGKILVDAPDGHFALQIGSAFVTNGAVGALDVTFAGGLITAASDSGIFDGMLPGVGGGSTFALDFTGLSVWDEGFTIEFDYGGANVNGYEMTMSSSLEDSLREVPEPATLALLLPGLLALFARRRNQA